MPADPLPTDAQGFRTRVDESRPRLNLIGQELARTALAILTEHATVQKKLPAAKTLPQAATDIAQQLQSLVPPRFMSRTPAARVAHLPRYLKAVAMRLDKLRTEPRAMRRVRLKWAPC
jgi:ATP-dependent helicase HrpA